MSSDEDQETFAVYVRAAFPYTLQYRVEPLLNVFNVTYRPLGGSQSVRVGDEDLLIPYRIYTNFPELRHLESLDPTQRIMFACILTRSFDGYVRDFSLRQILNEKYPWVVPFVLQLVGEYVVEIVQVIADNLQTLDESLYHQFAIHNPQFISRTKRRTISYWNEYNRRQIPSFTDYPGYKILKWLGVWEDDDVPRLLRKSK